jgi:hypothetical protein
MFNDRIISLNLICAPIDLGTLEHILKAVGANLARGYATTISSL